MPSRQMPSSREAALLDTTALRAAFLLEDLFVAGEVNLVYTDLDRAIVGSAMPTSQPLVLGNDEALRAGRKSPPSAPRRCQEPEAG